MTAYEQDLDRLRERLRLAIVADLRRRARRRRRVAQLALVPALALTAGGVAFAVVPVFNEPAPPRVQRNFDDVLRTTPAHSPFLPDEGSKLGLWARDGELALYGYLSPSGTVCTIADRGMPETKAVACMSDWERPGLHAIRMNAVGGATHREMNIVTGQVGAPDAVTVEVSAPGIPDAAQVPVGHDNWFIAQLPDSLLGHLDAGAQPPALSIVARDGSGTVVARSTEP